MPALRRRRSKQVTRSLGCKSCYNMFLGILMELLRSGLSVKKTVKSFSEKIEKQFLKMRRRKSISKPNMVNLNMN